MSGAAVDRPVRRLAAASAAAAAFLLLVVVKPGGATATRDVDDLAQALSPLLVAVPACWWAAWRATGPLRRSWLFFGCFAASWGVGQLTWCYLEIVRHQPGTTGSWSDIGFLAAPAFAAVAILSYPGPPLHWAGRFRALVDGFLVVTTLLFASWTAAVDTGALERSGAQFTQRVTVVTFPAADIVLLALLLTLIARSARSWRDPLLPVAGCIAALFLGDSMSIYVGLSGKYQTGSIVDVFWFAAFLLLAVAALSPWPAASDTVPALGAPPVWTEFFAYVPLCIALAMALVQLVRGKGFDNVEDSFAFGVVVLLVARGFLFVTENRALMSRLEASVGELEWLTLHDPLTGLANRVLFEDRLRHSLLTQQREHGTFAVAYVDLDDFKSINDIFGHDAGDDLLVEVGRRLTGAVRDEDTVARLGDDEFAILMRGSESIGQTASVLRRFVADLDEPFPIQGRLVEMHASIGFATSDGACTAEELLRNADMAMYAAKGEGKDRVHGYDPDRDRKGTTDAPTAPEIPVRLSPTLGTESIRLS